MHPRTVDLSELKTLVGQDLGMSGWHLVTQKEVNRFADATHDHQWIHVDPERAERESPFGGPVAHGYYTLGLAPHLMGDAVLVTGARMGLNYGLDKLRFPAPLRIGASVRLRVRLDAADDIAGGLQARLGLTWEVDGQVKPACVAEVIYRYYA